MREREDIVSEHLPHIADEENLLADFREGMKARIRETASSQLRGEIIVSEIEVKNQQAEALEDNPNL